MFLNALPDIGYFPIKGDGYLLSNFKIEGLGGCLLLQGMCFVGHQHGIISSQVGDFFFDGWLVKTVTLACSLLFTTLGIANRQLGIANRTRLLWTAVCIISFLRLLTQQLLLISGRTPLRPEWLGVACLDLVGNAAVDIASAYDVHRASHGKIHHFEER